VNRAQIKRRAPQWLHRLASRRALPARWWEHRLWLGFSDRARHELESRTRSWVPWRRIAARAALRRWESFTMAPSHTRVPARYRTNPAGVTGSVSAVSAPVDVVMISDFSLQGGTTSSNRQEILAQRDAGLRTGLVHHPIWDWDVTKPVSPQIDDLVDGDIVRWVDAGEDVSCDVLVIRAPKLGEVIMDDLPRITAASTVVVVNQTPFYYYGDAPSGVAYDLPTVFRNLSGAFGPAKWLPIGPAVREALVGFHGDDMDLSALPHWDWVNIIDAAHWHRQAPRVPDGTVRIGRHSRDDPVKWPERAEDLRATYPTDGSVEVHVLGGAETAREVLGAVPDSWVVHPFGSMDARAFLHELDVYVYFTASTYTEAFGRAPLEAMAAGVPVVAPWSFEPLFGEGATYSDPAGVAHAVAEIVADADSYARASGAAFSTAEKSFGYGAHVKRLADIAAKDE